MAESFHARIQSALMQVHSPRHGTDVYTAELTRDIATTKSGKVRLTLLLTPADEPSLARDVRQALERLEGVTEVFVTVKDPTPQGAPGGRALPVMNEPAARPVPQPQQPKHYPNLGRVIAVSSGKGGVGKSTVATNLAAALAARGMRVGLMDADVYGPNIPRMMGVNEPPPVINEKIIPLEAHGVKIMSLGFLIDRDQPAIWRGPIVMKIVNQFLGDVAWGQLDFLIVDMPPGTGDAQLSLVQATPVHGAVIVTTPQEVAVGDALRGVKMFERVNVPVLGVVENMSWLECPHCGKPMAIFGEGGGERLATECGIPLLAQIPLHPPVRQGGDTGQPIVVADRASSAAKALDDLAIRIMESAQVAAV